LTKKPAPPKKKTCTGTCGLELPADTDHFRPRGGHRAGKLFARCRECEAKAERLRYARENPLELSAEQLKGCAAWGTSLERQAVEAFVETGSLEGAAERLRMEPRLLRGMLGELARRAARQGYSPAHDMDKTTPDGFHVKGVSTYYGADGSKRGQWVKTKADEESRVQRLLDAVAALTEPFAGTAPAPDAPTYTDEDLLCVIPIGDPHIGMHAWSAEVGEDFDLKIAERDLCTAVDHLIAVAPPAKECLIMPLGDMVHADNKSNTTTRGTPVDVDTRQSKVLGVVIRTIASCVIRALEKFDVVRLVVINGNHDDYTSLILAHTFAAFFRDNPRVIVDTSPAKFRWHRFGKVLIGMTHGDTCKRTDLPQIMACDRPQDWAETAERLWYTGHVHHETVTEMRGCTVESFRTLASSDAWHHASGYRSGRDLRLDVLHREHGRINRHIVGIRQIRAKQASGR
jgi:hypothetical protein